MDLRAKTDDCLILRGRDYNESDRLLVVFGRDLGKLSCIAKGVRRTNSRLKAGTQLFSYSTLTFAAPKGGLNLITQSEAKNVHADIRADLTKIAVASYISEILDAVLPEAKPQENIFVLTESMLSLLAAGAEPFLVLACFRVRLSAMLGFRLNFANCALCGKQAAVYVSAPARGGVLCPVCAAKARDNVRNERARRATGTARLSAEAVRLLAGLAGWDLRRIFSLRISPAVQAEVEAAMEDYLNFYIGIAAKNAAENLRIYYRI